MISNMATPGDVYKTSKEDNDETTDEETDDEEEPRLKYTRLGNDVLNILKKDAASTIAVHYKFLALGTHYGFVYILDHDGNQIKGIDVALHTCTVNQISLDLKGEHLASCSDDGKVVVVNLCYTNTRPYAFFMDRPVKAVALDPLYHHSTCRLVSGGDKVKLHEKSGFLGMSKETVLYHGEAPIRLLSWRGSYLAWATDRSVRIFDMDHRTVISVVKEEPNPGLRLEMFRCSLSWKGDHTLLIGRVDCVRVLNIHPMARTQLPDRAGATEISAMLTTPFYLCGVAPLGNQIVVLSIPKDTKMGGGEEVEGRPQLNVLEASSGMHYNEVCHATLCLRRSNLPAMCYQLECLNEEGLFFIVSPKDVIVARPWEESDHIAWLLERERYQEAVLAVLGDSSMKDKKETLQKVGRVALESLFQRQRYKEAADLCPKIFGALDPDVALRHWEQELYRFASAGQLRALAPHLAPNLGPRLSPTLYEMVLNEYIQLDPEGLLERVREWPTHFYQVEHVIQALLNKMSTLERSEAHLCALGELYRVSGRLDKALTVFLKLELKEKVFPLLSEHNMVEALRRHMEALLTLDAEAATQLLVDHTDSLPIGLVVEQLRNSPFLLYKYLDRIVHRSPHLAEGHHGLLVELYARFEPTRLKTFLRSSNTYPLEESMAVCQRYGLVEEAIFLLSRMGNTRQALQQTLEKLGDVQAAIALCREHEDDPELWADLLEASLGRPDFITALLQGVGAHLNPAVVVKRIPDQLPIPGLRDALVTLLQDFNLQTSLREGCKRILVTDCFNLLDRLTRQQKRGLHISDSQVCQGCRCRVTSPDVRFTTDIQVFFCHHSFHKSCLPYKDTNFCPICTSQSAHASSKG